MEPKKSVGPLVQLVRVVPRVDSPYPSESSGTCGSTVGTMQRISKRLVGLSLKRMLLGQFLVLYTLCTIAMTLEILWSTMMRWIKGSHEPAQNVIDINDIH
ncbi:hypothetical protein OS493_009007 [Desmophyllum pertusum]|uniref:Uncharacterized protein n=1 Tax=Desmophyllum pertusum TaxID=174260 RepID=A0A9W9ZFG5_9CNID|nr:hypothetical protein OS493_009007 [Desmophyllum pertusum]